MLTSIVGIGFQAKRTNWDLLFFFHSDVADKLKSLLNKEITELRLQAIISWLKLHNSYLHLPPHLNPQLYTPHPSQSEATSKKEEDEFAYAESESRA